MKAISNALKEETPMAIKMVLVSLLVSEYSSKIMFKDDSHPNPIVNMLSWVTFIDQRVANVE